MTLRFSLSTAMALAGAVLATALVLGAAGVVLLAGPGHPMNDAPPGASPRAREAYQIAAQNHDLFVHLPCYCGCAALTPAHRNLYDCFRNADGSLNAHAVGCDTCESIALDAAQALNDGASHAAIRALVDAKYAQVGRPTDTPPPAE